MLDHRLSSSEKISLCRGASGSAPSTCFASSSPSVSPKGRVVLCRGASEAYPTAPAICFRNLPQSIPQAPAVELCQGAVNSMAAECAKVARHIVGNSDQLLTLCRGANSTAPADCAKAVVREGADKHLAAVICAHSTSLTTASCFAATPRYISIELRAEVCIGAQSTNPAHCLEAATPRSRKTQADEAQCPLDPEVRSLPRRAISHRLAVRLCKHASDTGPAECGQKAPTSMRDDDLEVLCSAVGRSHGEATARCAKSALSVGISSSNAAALCTGARTDAPVHCYAAVGTLMGQATRIAVCAGASSDVPARCIASLSPLRTPSEADIAECRTSVPRPSGLRITRLSHAGEALYPNQPMHATLEVLDQWGGGIISDNSSVVSASVGLKGSNGAVVNALGRFNVSSQGFVFFSRLSFSGPGSLTLHFFLNSNGKVKSPSAAARVIVAETDHGVTVRRCGKIFRLLSCPWSVTRPAKSNHDVGFEYTIPTEAVSIVGGGMVAAWSVFTCQTVFEENGLHVAYLSGGNHPFAAWLWYHPGIEVLETGVGLPRRDQPPWETLGVERDASAKRVRRAYYRQSLMWHPDRWIRYAMHSARAQEMFEIVSEAYTRMAPEADGQRPETV